MSELNNEAYVAWKGWTTPNHYGAMEIYNWNTLHALVNLKKGEKILELGFGPGGHLDFCQKNGIEAIGVEQNKQAYESAKKFGLNVHLGRIQDLPFTKGQFDAVFAIEVIEHIPLNELIEVMKHLRTLLKDQGTIVATMPNGASPFGRYYQHGDLTHVNAFNRASLTQLGVLTGFKVAKVVDSPEYFELKKLKQFINFPIRWILRRLYELVARAYMNEPMGLSITCIFEKAD